MSQLPISTRSFPLALKSHLVELLMQYCPPLAAAVLRKRQGEPAHPLRRGSFLGFLMSANEISLSEATAAASSPPLADDGRGHCSQPPPLASPRPSPLADPPQSPHSSFRPPARLASAAPSVRLLPPPPLPPPIISVCLLLSLRVDGRTDLL